MLKPKLWLNVSRLGAFIPCCSNKLFKLNKIIADVQIAGTYFIGPSFCETRRGAGEINELGLIFILGWQKYKFGSINRVDVKFINETGIFHLIFYPNNSKDHLFNALIEI